jgi:hypothetical protein
MALSKTTQDHDEIRKWAESRGAVPADVASTESDDQTGILRFEFPKAKNANDSKLQEISWEDFFEKFDRSGLALVYQDVTADGKKSNFNKFVHPENAKDAGTSKKTARSGSKASSAKKPAARHAAEKKHATSAKKTGTRSSR